MRITTFTLGAALLMSTTALTLAGEVKKPDSTATCMGLLFGISMEIKAGKVSADKVQAIKPQASQMAKDCQTKKFDEAFKIYGVITKAAGLSK